MTSIMSPVEIVKQIKELSFSEEVSELDIINQLTRFPVYGKEEQVLGHLCLINEEAIEYILNNL